MTEFLIVEMARLVHEPSLDSASAIDSVA